MTSALHWASDGADWPHREASRFVRAGGLNWHVQQMGSGPVLLLIHGTGASSHSWRALMPRLARHAHLVVPDLPGHAFTERAWGAGLSLPGMAGGLADLLAALDVRPAAIVGHSAGAAIGARLVLDRAVAPAGLIGLNAALLPFPGVAGHLFPSMAKLLFVNPLASFLLSRRAANRDAVAKVIAGTGSRLDAGGLDLYARLFRSTGHVGAVLGMMAQWDLNSLLRDLPTLGVPLTLVSGGRDRAVPVRDAEAVQRLLPATRLITLPKLGHLAHEEAPDELAGLILDQLAAWQLGVDQPTPGLDGSRHV